MKKIQAGKYLCNHSGVEFLVVRDGTNHWGSVVDGLNHRLEFGYGSRKQAVACTERYIDRLKARGQL